MATTKELFRLRNMKINRVDLVDRGANQDAHIVLAKRDDMPADKVSDKAPPAGKSSSKKPAPMKVEGSLAERIRAAMAEAAGGGAPGKEEPPAPESSPLSRPKGDQQRISRIRPADFELVEQNAQMMEWAIPEDKLPDGVEEATMTLIQGGEEVMFQWMIDPLAGPPVSGEAKSAPEAYAAMRAALTQGGAMDPMAMLGGLPGQKAAPGQPGAQAPGGGGQPQKPAAQKPAAPPAEKKPVMKAFAEMSPRKRRLLKAAATLDGSTKPVSTNSQSDERAKETVDNTLDLIVKGLVEVDVFNETATGADLRDILPLNLLAKITDQLSAK
jgi:hypothetical protein